MARLSRWVAVACLASCCAPLSLVWGQADPAAPQPLPAAFEPSPLLDEPKTPEEFFAATVLLVELARFDLAQQYLAQFEALEPSAELLLQLRAKHGTAEFLRFARMKELQPAGSKILARLNAAAQQQAEDPAFVDGMLNQLAGTPAERDLAIRELRNIGSRAVPQALRRLAVSQSPDEREMLIVALSRMGHEIVPALIAGLDSPSDAVQLGCIEALNLQNATAAEPYLWSLAFSETIPAGTQQAARRTLAKLLTGNPERVDRLSSALAEAQLRDRATKLFEGRASAETDPNAEPSETLTVWKWDEAEGTIVSADVPMARANSDLAARMAREALALSPERPENQRLMLETSLANEIQSRGWDEPLPQDLPAMRAAITSGEPLLRDVLRDSLKAGRPDAAWAALQALSQVSTPSTVIGGGGARSPVQAALNYPDPRVQFAAAATVLRSEPRRSFPGADRVVQILRRALTDPGVARGLVIDPVGDRGATVGQFLAEQGFDPLTARTGKEGFTQAATLAGVDLIVLHVTSLDWPLTQTLSNLRADARTAFVPVVLYGPEETRSATARLVDRSQPALFVAEAPGAVAFWEQAEEFVRRRQTPPLSAAQRAEFRELAAYWLANIATGPMAGTFDITPAEKELVPQVMDESVAANALVALGNIPSNGVQSRLAEFSLNPQLSATTREQAAQQLTLHMARFGALLSEENVSALSEGLDQEEDPSVQSAIAAVLGALRPNPGLVRARLQRLVTPGK